MMVLIIIVLFHNKFIGIIIYGYKDKAISRGHSIQVQLFIFTNIIDYTSEGEVLVEHYFIGLYL
jgi:hypothetical protein